MMSVNSYWRTGPVLNNAIAGVDMALWDIKGKVAGMPVYDLWGGKCREAAMVYRHADGREPAEVLDAVLAYREAGVLAVRCQMGGYGGRTRIGRQILTPRGGPSRPSPARRSPAPITTPIGTPARRSSSSTMSAAPSAPTCICSTTSTSGWRRSRPSGWRRRSSPTGCSSSRTLCRPTSSSGSGGSATLPPRRSRWASCGSTRSNGETLISERLIDFVRAHVSAIGGVTPARKLAAFAEAFGVRTAWHGPGDVSPIGHAANVHLDLACHNFGIQEVPAFSDALREVFPGTPVLRGGYLHVNDDPGWGVDLDEAAAARYPIEPAVVEWTQARWPDGTLWTP